MLEDMLLHFPHGAAPTVRARRSGPAPLPEPPPQQPGAAAAKRPRARSVRALMRAGSESHADVACPSRPRSSGGSKRARSRGTSEHCAAAPAKRSCRSAAASVTGVAPAASALDGASPRKLEPHTEALRLWCARVDMLAPGGQLHKDCATPGALRDLLMADLLAISLSLLRLEVTDMRARLLPTLTATFGGAAVLPEPHGNTTAAAALRDLRVATETLRSTKLFVKDYRGEVAPQQCGVRFRLLLSAHSCAALAYCLSTVLRSWACAHGCRGPPGAALKA